MNKNFKIWGVSYGIIGDLIMALPVLTYFEKKYPDSYKFWVIEKKCSQALDLFINHPLIDKIKITDNWSSFGEEDLKIFNSCDFKCKLNQNHDCVHWYNERNCIEETARIAGITDLNGVLSPQDFYPNLYKWFESGIKPIQSTAYTTEYDSSQNIIFKNSIAIWPFAGYGDKTGRSPSEEWWSNSIKKITDLGINVYHYGYGNEPTLSNSMNYKKFIDLSFFDQIKYSLESDLCVTTDSGSGWVLGAYSKSCIYLITNWLPNHNRNFDALTPVNINGVSIFEKNGCDNICIERFIETVKIKLGI